MKFEILNSGDDFNFQIAASWGFGPQIFRPPSIALVATDATWKKPTHELYENPPSSCLVFSRETCSRSRCKIKSSCLRSTIPAKKTMKTFNTHLSRAGREKTFSLIALPASQPVAEKSGIGQNCRATIPPFRRTSYIPRNRCLFASRSPLTSFFARWETTAHYWAAKSSRSKLKICLIRHTSTYPKMKNFPWFFWRFFWKALKSATNSVLEGTWRSVKFRQARDQGGDTVNFRGHHDVRQKWCVKRRQARSVLLTVSEMDTFERSCVRV